MDLNNTSCVLIGSHGNHLVMEKKIILTQILYLHKSPHFIVIIDDINEVK